MNAKISSWLKGWRLLLLVYGALLLGSHIWEWTHHLVHKPTPQQKTIQLHAVSGDSIRPNQSIKLAYIDEYNGTASNPPVVLLLHGSPIAVPMFSNLIPKLSQRFRVIAPDMPGYDASERDVPSYSIRSFSIYTKQLIDSLHVNKIHVVGYSLGGGVAINMVHFYPKNVKSLDLLSSIGVQELELLGSYHLNHAIHGVQLSFIWLVQEMVPHFGYLTDFPLDIPYARSFYDSDQRPLRGYLKAYKKPMLIQQGRDDELVPFVAAEEHHRIVPQSTFLTYKGGHGMVRSNSGPIAKDLIAFVDSVEAGQAATYAQANPERLKAAQKPFKDIEFEKFKGITLFIIMLLLVFGTLISEDLTCIGAGLIAARGLIGFWDAVLACFIGILLGDILLYLSGRWFGRSFINRAPLKWFISEKDLSKSEKWFKKKGPGIIIASRFLPGSRMPTYFSAGAIGAGFWMFTFYFLMACLIWTPLLVGTSMLVGSELMSYFSIYKEYALWIFLGIVVVLLAFVKFIIPAFSYRGRRFLRSRWNRFTQWEFWPASVLYFPVCVYITGLWLKFKHLTIFTAADPCIKDGGFIGESKKQILDLFDVTGCVASYHFLSSDDAADTRVEQARGFMKQQELSFPVVIKPDAGQRGAGVKIIHDESDLQKAIQAVDYDLIIQRYLEGNEYGIFYYRYPDEEKGCILSITKKKLLKLRGDGEHTVEELILNDERAVSLAKKHLEYHQEHLYDIPKKGEIIKLVEFGTHARGAVFSDGADLITEKLVQSIDNISQQVDGFYFGRFDIRTPSEETLTRGEELHVIEVNGVTSEDTSIYDKKYSFWDAQRKLRKQWRIAFEIGSECVQNGASFSSIPDLVKELVHYKAK